jgi:hypothetical protein
MKRIILITLMAIGTAAVSKAQDADSSIRKNVAGFQKTLALTEDQAAKLTAAYKKDINQYQAYLDSARVVKLGGDKKALYAFDLRYLDKFDPIIEPILTPEQKDKYEAAMEQVRRLLMMMQSQK